MQQNDLVSTFHGWSVLRLTSRGARRGASGVCPLTVAVSIAMRRCASSAGGSREGWGAFGMVKGRFSANFMARWWWCEGEGEQRRSQFLVAGSWFARKTPKISSIGLTRSRVPRRNCSSSRPFSTRVSVARTKWMSRGDSVRLGNHR